MQHGNGYWNFDSGIGMKAIKMKSRMSKAVYSGLVKKICFKYDEEKVHNFFVNAGKSIESNSLSNSFVKMMFNYQNPILEQDLLGIKFRNPVGLSAGFDKNAELIPIMESIGFGFVEVGSVTAKPCNGNDGVRLLRIPEEKAIWVNLGLNNNGTDEISSRLKGKSFGIPFGVSIAKTNCIETLNVKIGVKDYAYSFMKFNNNHIGSYYTLNISCPNAYGGQPFSDPKLLESLLKEVKKLKIKKPIFLKLSPDLDIINIDKIIDLSEEYEVNGFICSNLTKKDIGFDTGGLSGKRLSDKSEKLLSYVYKKTRNWKNEPVLIGVGGIFSAEDAYKKIKLGANLVQMITGMIYQGPGVISEIKYELVKLLQKDGFSNISEAVGTGYKGDLP